MLQKVGCEVLAVSLCWEYATKGEFHRLDLPSGATTPFSTVTFLPLNLLLAPALSSLMGWEHLLKFINCINIFAVFLMLLRIFFPSIQMLSVIFLSLEDLLSCFSFSVLSMFDTSLVIRIEA